MISWVCSTTARTSSFGASTPCSTSTAPSRRPGATARPASTYWRSESRPRRSSSSPRRSSGIGGGGEDQAALLDRDALADPDVGQGQRARKASARTGDARVRGSPVPRGFLRASRSRRPHSTRRQAHAGNVLGRDPRARVIGCRVAHSFSWSVSRHDNFRVVPAPLLLLVLRRRGRPRDQAAQEALGAATVGRQRRPRNDRGLPEGARHAALGRRTAGDRARGRARPDARGLEGQRGGLAALPPVRARVPDAGRGRGQEARGRDRDALAAELLQEPHPRRRLPAGPENWLSVEDLASFEVGGVEVLLRMDLAYRRATAGS